MAYTSSTDLLIEQRQVHPKHAITQIHPVLTRGDQQTLQDCLQASHQHSQPVSPGSKIYLDLLRRKRKRKQQAQIPDVDCVNTIEHEYAQYKLKHPCIPSQQSMTDATDPHLEGRNTRPRPTPESVPENGEVPFSNTGTDANPNHQDVDMEPGVPLHMSVPPLANAPSLQQIQPEDIQLDHTIKQTTALHKKTKKKRK
jgi:hypothetical protein